MGIKDKILDFTKSLSVLIDSGMTIKDGVELTVTLFPKGNFHQVIERIDDKLERGESFSAALSGEEIFPGLYKGLIHIGERTGSLNLVLKQLVVYLTMNRKINQRLKAATLYPAMLLVLIISGIGALFFYFLPRLQDELAFDPEVMAQLDVSLTTAKLILLFFTFFLFLGIAIPVTYGSISKKAKNGDLWLHRFVLWVPFLGSYLKKREMLNIFFTLTLTSRCSVPLEDSLKLVNLVVKNRYLAKRLLLIRENLMKGERLSVLFSRDPSFPEEIHRWITMGERVGKVESVFSQLNEYYREEVERISEIIVNLIEPVASLIIGMIILTVVVLLIVPIMTLYGGLI